MAGRPPPVSQPSPDSVYSSEPFADRPRALQFQEPQVRPFDSTVSLSQEFGGQGAYEDEEVEKQPLTSGNVPGGFYPPG